MKTISWIILFTFVITSSAFAVEAPKGIFMTYTTSQRLLGDLKYQQKNVIDLNLRLSNRDGQIETLDKEVAQLKLKETTQQTDIGKLTAAKDQYKDLYENTDKKLVKCVEDKPSRLAWFGYGSLTALLVGVVAIVFIKK